MAYLNDDLEARVMGILTRYSMPEGSARIGVAVSGGADSVALLHLLFRCLKNPTKRLVVLHVNHHLRGAESDADQAFVQEMAESLHLPFYVEAGESTVSETGNLEQTARELRRQFFFRLQEKLGLTCIALGHNQSDQAETMLFRLLRGSGMTGMAAMRLWSADGLFRPLLVASRAAIREWAAAQGLAWREDSSNGDLRFTRNRIRQQVMPLLEDVNPHFEAALAQFAEISQEEENWWAESAANALEQLNFQETVFGTTIRADKLAELHPALGRRVVRFLLAQVRGDLSGIESSHVRAVLDLCGVTTGHDRVLLPGIDAVRSFHTLLLTEPGRLAGQGRGFTIAVLKQGSYPLPLGGYVQVDGDVAQAEFCGNFKTDLNQMGRVSELYLPSSASGSLEPFAFVLRNWEPGDALRRLGHHRPEKIKALFQQFRILLWERRHWPVLVQGNEIAWAWRFGPSAAFLSKRDGSSILRITYAGPLG